MLSRFPLLNFYVVKSPYEYALCETRTPEILIGTRTTYQATGDAGTKIWKNENFNAIRNLGG